MRKHELELAIRSAGKLAKETEFFLIGSQAVHACGKRAPAEVLMSQECDLYPRNNVQAVAMLDRELGKTSRFAREHSFYVDVVTPEIASLPDGWQARLKLLRVGKIKVYCLEIHYLLVSKLAAGRLKDLEFAGALFRLGIAKPKVVRTRLD